jgi:hypothetical protein
MEMLGEFTLSIETVFRECRLAACISLDRA